MNQCLSTYSRQLYFKLQGIFLPARVYNLYVVFIFFMLILEGQQKNIFLNTDIRFFKIYIILKLLLPSLI